MMTDSAFPSVLTAGAPTLTLTALLVLLIAAAPAVPEAHAQQQYQQRAPGANVQNAPVETHVPSPSDDPEGVPLGGLEWLALAGGAYAANRLRKRGKDDDDEGEPGEELP